MPDMDPMTPLSRPLGNPVARTTETRPEAISGGNTVHPAIVAQPRAKAGARPNSGKLLVVATHQEPHGAEHSKTRIRTTAET